MRLPGRSATPAELLGVLDPRWYARLFDALGARYEEFPFTRGTEQEVGFLVAALELTPAGTRAGSTNGVGAMRILDVGCGTARHAIEFAAAGFSVTGVDLSLRLLEIGLENARKRDAIVNLMHADAREMPFEASFDAALSLCEGAFGLLEDDAQDRRVLERMRRALRPGGRLALNAINRLHLASRAGDLPGFDPATGGTIYTERMTLESGERVDVRYRNRAHDPEELTRIVEGAGFAVDGVYGCSPGDFGRHPPDARHYGLLLLGRAV